MANDDRTETEGEVSPLLAPQPKSPVERASESIISIAPAPPRPMPAVSSGPFEIAPSSIGPVASAPSLPPISVPDSPPSTVIANAMGRNRAMPLSTIVAVGCGVFVVLVGLALLLFR